MSAYPLGTPGSDEALSNGCRCPVLDNGHGKGYLGGVTDDNGRTIYVISEACDLHRFGAVEPARGGAA